MSVYLLAGLYPFSPCSQHSTAPPSDLRTRLSLQASARGGPDSFWKTIGYVTENKTGKWKARKNLRQERQEMGTKMEFEMGKGKNGKQYDATNIILQQKQE